LQLSYQERTFEVDARVVTHHIGMGMGLVFDEIGPEQKFILLDWISNRLTDSPLVAEGSQATEQTTIPEPSSTPERALLVKLVQLLESNGKLAPAEISRLLSDQVNV
jgi:hypothetical protein